MSEGADKSSAQPADNTPIMDGTTPNTGRRLRIGEVKLSVQLTKKQILDKWGQPDAIEGFGVEYLVYRLEDGRMLWLLFASQTPQPLLKAMVFANSTGAEGKTIFDGTNETKLR